MKPILLCATFLAACGGTTSTPPADLLTHVIRDLGDLPDIAGDFSAAACVAKTSYYAVQGDAGTSDCLTLCAEYESDWDSRPCSEDGGLLNGACYFVADMGFTSVACTVSVPSK